MQYNKKIDLLQDIELVVGVDIAKTTHYISLKGRDGRELNKPHKIANTNEGFEELLKILADWNKEKVLIGMEPTGHYWKALAFWMKQRGYKVVLVNPYHLCRTKEVLFNTKNKTDSKDCKLVAQMVVEGKFLEALLHAGIYADLRELCKARAVQTQEIVRTKIRIIALFDEFLPEYNHCFFNITCRTSIALLKKFDLSTLKSCELITEKIVTLYNASHGQINHEKATNIVDTLAKSIGVSEGLVGAQLMVANLIEQFELNQKMRNRIEHAIKEKLDQTEEASILLSMHGMGVITAAEFLGQTGPLARFSNAKKIEKLAGLELTENSSGKHVGKKSFSKRGRDPLRNVLYKIVLAAIPHDNRLRDLYLYKVNVLKKPKMVAIGSIMAKIIRIIFGMVKNKRYYREEYINVPVNN